MKLIYYSFIIIFFIVGIALSQPKLFVDKDEIDLGTVYNGEKKNGKIIIKNIGKDTLHIFYVGSSCGCTTVKNPKEFLPPGQSDYIEYEFSPFGTPGIVEKYINIQTNDTTAKTLGVKLIADVKELLQSISGPNTLYIIENAVIKKSITKRMVMKNISGSPIIIRGDSVSSASITVQMDKKNLQPNDTLNVDITVLPEKLGLSNETFYIMTDRRIIQAWRSKLLFLGLKGIEGWSQIDP
jgi:Protein of unknown function (DUF1573).